MSFKILDYIEKTLKRPARVIGDISTEKHSKYVFINGEVKKKEVTFNPGINKLIREIIDNSIDEYIRSKGSASTKIEVFITEDGSIKVTDNGRGIPIIPVKDPEGNDILMPEAAWTRLDAGANFDDKADNTSMGQNGEGSAAVCIYSVLFKGNTVSDGKEFIMVCEDNLSKKNVKTKETKKKNGTSVEFTPDYKIFGETNIPEDNIDVLRFDLLNLSMTYPGIKFSLNKEVIKPKNLKDYGSMVTGLEAKDFEYFECKGLKVVISSSSSDEFEFIQYVNGLNVYNGGETINWFLNNLVQSLMARVSKKYKTIKPADIKNKIFISLVFDGIYNPRFADQIKSKCVNKYSDFKSQIDDIDFDKLAGKVYRNESIINPIVDYFKIKEEFKKKQELKKLDKAPKKIKSEKYTKPVGESKTLIICEGACLEENTELLDVNLEPKKIKDFRQNDYIISGDGTVQEIVSITKNLREVVYMKTKSGVIKCSRKHRWYVYIKDAKKFDYVEAGVIIQNKDNYALVKNKINQGTLFEEILDNKDNTIYCPSGIIQYTSNDYFLVLDCNKDIVRKHGSELIQGECLILSEY
jgi:DNA gyrase/topoisomerase IV subunit B